MLSLWLDVLDVSCYYISQPRIKLLKLNNNKIRGDEWLKNF